MKKKGYSDVDIKCPFFVSENRQDRSITCEGFSDCVKTSCKFSSLKDRTDHIKRCCSDGNGYTFCPLYKMAMTKYDSLKGARDGCK